LVSVVGVIVALVITCNLYKLYYNTKVEYVQEVPRPVLMDNLAEVAYIEIFLKTNHMQALAAKYIELCWGLWPQLKEISQYRKLPKGDP